MVDPVEHQRPRPLQKRRLGVVLLLGDVEGVDVSKEALQAGHELGAPLPAPVRVPQRVQDEGAFANLQVRVSGEPVVGEAGVGGVVVVFVGEQM
eukprot:CAMPEP_0196666592 /NCGR_PEP_ID=MMETSP1086-20130531/64601_1 /TAXON_ID=77921 /ORGANISM="Cyanoptyche  gloeocystis , Strain SAG4.97" /LENGTH=93 /DNA_ID=CAMNT_0042003803 /DNA_START=1096 /DNA_END=1377 /DNA_ORIENTATION=+